MCNIENYCLEYIISTKESDFICFKHLPLTSEMEQTRKCTGQNLLLKQVFEMSDNY